jgi:small-conductance mechanosensitive channel
MFSGKFIKSFRGARLAMATLWLVISPISVLVADEPSSGNSITDAVLEDLQETLEEEQKTLIQRRQELEALQQKGETQEPADANILEQASTAVENARLREENLTTLLTNTKRRLKELENRLAQLKQRKQLLENPARDAEQSTPNALARVQNAIPRTRTEYDLVKARVQVLTSLLSVAKKRLSLLASIQSNLEQQYLNQESQFPIRSNPTRESEKRRLETQLNKLEQRLARDGGDLTLMQRNQLETEFQILEARLDLLPLKDTLDSATRTLNRLQPIVDLSLAEPQVLEEALARFRRTQTQLNEVKARLARQQSLWQVRQAGLATRETQRIADQRQLIDDLLNTIKTQLIRTQALRKRARNLETALLERYQEALQEALSERVAWPNTEQDWQELADQLQTAPAVVVNQIRLSFRSAVNAATRTTVADWIMLAFSTILVTLLLFWIRHAISHSAERIEADSHKDSPRAALAIGLRLLHHHLPSVGLAVVLLLIVFNLPIPSLSRRILATLAILYIAIRLPISLSWLLLVSPDLPAERQRRKVHRQWLVALIVGVFLAAAVTLTRLSALDATLVAFFDRLLMLYLVLMSPLLLHARRLFLQLLGQRYRTRPWFWILRFGSLALAGILGLVGLVGVVGYLNLAWFIARYLSLTLILALGWLLLQGLLNDIMTRLDRDFIDHYRSWPKTLFTFLHSIANIALALGVALGMVWLFGWGQEVPLVQAWELLAITVAAILIVHEIAYSLISELAQRVRSPLLTALLKRSRRPLGIILPLVTLQIIVPNLTLPESVIEPAHRLLALMQIAAIAWLLLRLVGSIDDIVDAHYQLNVKDNLNARRVRTQLQVLRQTAQIAIYFIAIAGALMTFPAIRQLGTGLLASAGVAGLVVGMAARPLLANLIAGIQIALTQPIRVDDVVIVEGEWGRIAEITATYVVVRIWDDRRLVVPLNYFNEQPFQNWTRRSSDLLGTAFFHVDYTFPVEEGRRVLRDILESTDLWDGRVCVLQVTNATEQTVELRALMSATDASTAWDLRCYVRESFVKFLQENYPDALPKTRALLEEFEKSEESEKHRVIQPRTQIIGKN